MAKQKNFILAISGVSGAGKTSVAKVLESNSEFQSIPSCTTRLPRPGETNGVDYFFISDEEFDLLKAKKAFVESVEANGARYGKRKVDFDNAFKAGKTPYIIVDFKGILEYKKKFKSALTIYIAPPSIEDAIERLKKRGTETADQIKIRLSQYKNDIAGEKGCDYTIVNDSLERAQAELLQIVEKEKKKRQARKNIARYLLLPLLFLFLAGAAYASQEVDFKNLPYINKFFPVETEEVKSTEEAVAPAETAPAAVETPTIVAPPPKAVANTIKKAPPKTEAPKTTPVEETKQNTDGSATTTVSTSGGASSADLAKAAASAGVVVNSISDIPFTDQTGSHSDLGQILKDYLSSTLEHRDEVTSLKSITLEDAGATGWNGQYLGSYTIGSDGRDITSANGTIILNSYYYNDSPIFNDYMKLIFSHEYGHHYTLYHKWVDWDLSITERLPDSYYSTRPLSETTTAVDYSLGWRNCESEIIAEDYSYIYSGYGVNAMAATYGYPSSALRSWLEQIGSSELLSSTVANNPPILTITAPSVSANLSGTADFSADATDDHGVGKVSFYIDENLISEDSTAPYAAPITTLNYQNGAHTLKAVATDGVLTAEQSIIVSIDNQTNDTEKPTISVLSPDSNPITITQNNLLIHAVATDNDQVAKIEMYHNDTLQESWDTSDLSLKITLSTPGTYDLKFKAYDRAGNSVEIVLSVIRALLTPPTP
ncbi:MAG: Ig-like domain-containing protein [Patescibacteria group bacterium]|jgi:guanylate kinase